MDIRRLLLVTTITTAFTALVGVITATSGAGLTCEARWPLCDGAVFGLFPANFMSFIEWSHRLVAMITGFLIIGSAVAAWRGDHVRRIRFATLAALLLTPLQIVFGAFTVLVNRLVFGYSIVVLTLHFTLASLILALLVAATVWAYAETTTMSTDRIQAAAVAALLGFPVMVALTPRLFVAFGELTQFVYYALGFGMFAALCLVSLWGRELGARGVTYTGGFGAILVVSNLIIARRAFGNDGQLLILGLSFVAFALTLLAIRRTRTLSGRSPPPATTGD